MDGFHICDVLRNSAETASLPVILTAKGEPSDRIKVWSLGRRQNGSEPFECSQKIVLSD